MSAGPSGGENEVAFRRRIKPKQYFTVKHRTHGKTKSERIINWIEQLPVHRGRFNVGQKVKLFDYQRSIIHGIFDEDKSIRHAIVSLPRKQAKSQIAVWLLLAHLLMEELQRPSAQLFAVSVTTKQAKLLFRSIVDIIDQLDWQTQEQCRIVDGRDLISIPAKGIVFQVIASDASGARLQGFEPQFAVLDEAGSFESVMPYQSLKTANPHLLLLISTQCHLPNAEESWFTKVLHEQTLPSHHYRYFLGATKEEAAKRWDDPEVWKRVTPAPEIKSMDYLREEANDAKVHGNVNSFRVFHLNALVPSLSSEISIYTQEELEACWQPNSRIPTGARVIIGLDLSQVTDLCGIVVMEIATGVTESFAFVPRAAVEEGRGNINYQQWQTEGFCKISEGKCVSFKEVALKIKDYERRFKAVAVCKDHWLANQYQIIADEQGVRAPHVNVQQRGRSIGVATKKLQELIKQKKLLVTSPILRWNLNCTKWSEDTFGNIRPHKGLSQAKQKANRVDLTFALCNNCWWLAENATAPSTRGFTIGFL